MGKARDLAPDVIDQYANGYIDAMRSNAGDAARVALEAGLVTGIKTDDEVTTRVQRAGWQKMTTAPAIAAIELA